MGGKKVLYGAKILAEDFAYSLNNRARGLLIDYVENLEDHRTIPFEEAASRYGDFSGFFAGFDWNGLPALTAIYDEQDLSFFVGVDAHGATRDEKKLIHESFESVFIEFPELGMISHGE